MTIAYSLTGNEPITREVAVIVRPPVEVLTRREPIALKPGGMRSIWVGLRRELAAAVEVELKIEGLPSGVKLKRPVTLVGNETEAKLEIEMESGSKPLTGAVEVRIVAVARMPRGSVSVESRNRPMLVSESAEEKGRGLIE